MAGNLGWRKNNDSRDMGILAKCEQSDGWQNLDNEYRKGRQNGFGKVPREQRDSGPRK